MSSEEDKIKVQRSDGSVDELSSDELEQLNYERKVRDQEATGHLVSAKQINIAAVIVCFIVLVYALPQIFLGDDSEPSSYVPLDERNKAPSYEDLYPNIPEPVEIIPLQPMPSVIQDPNYANEVAVETIKTDEVITESTDPTKTSTIQRQEISTKQSESSGNTEQVQVAIIESLNLWAADWSAQNVEAYLSHYSENFVSDKGLRINAWKQYRTGRVTRPEWIDVNINDIEILSISENRAIVEFSQGYNASNYKELSKKRIEFEKITNAWKILKEENVL